MSSLLTELNASLLAENGSFLELDGSSSPPPTASPSLVGSSSAGPTGSSTVSVTNTVPAGIANGDLMLWMLTSNVNTQPNTPTGWSIWQTVVEGSTGAHGATIFYRVASSEPSSYEATVASGKWNGILSVYRGVNTTTPKDVENTTSSGTTSPAITTVTANALVLQWGRYLSGTGDNTTVWESSGTVREAVSQPSTTVTNIGSATADQIATSAGTVTPTLTRPAGGTTSSRIVSALRPA